jgi:acetate---CoA ligase (ADP-forming)
VPLGLARLLNPRSVAIVGATERQYRSNNAMQFLTAAGIEVLLVNPNRGEVYGRPTFPSLTAIGRPIDAVLSIVNAAASVSVVEEAARTGCGGVVILAGGFAETGPEGLALQDELKALAVASGMPVVGPNCVGFVNVRTGAWVSGAPRAPHRIGSIGVITHSGALMRVELAAAAERGLGVSYIISTGNEAVTDMVDYLDFLVDDPDTRAIGLAVENVRRPREFLAAADRALRARKPIVALKLGRSARGREIAKSHTGSLVADGWAYEIAFRHCSIQLASDIDDLFDRLALFDQVEPSKWTSAEAVAVVTVSGGAASLVSDRAEVEGVALPRLSGFEAWVAEQLPGVTTPNPLDMTGFILAQPEVLKSLLRKYIESPEVDTLVVIWGLGDGDEEFGAPVIDAVLELAPASTTPVIVASVEAVVLAPWTERLRSAGVARGRGVGPTLRALATMAAFIRSTKTGPDRRALPARISRPPTQAITTAEGSMLPFVQTMQLLEGAGIPVAPHHVVEPDEELRTAELGFPGPFVAKLSDVAHRTELGAVLKDLTASDLPGAIANLRQTAGRHSLCARVVIQPLVHADTEAFIGIETSSPFGPMVIFGVGGIFVEVLRRTSGRLAPLDRHDAQRMLAELDLPSFFVGFRGSRPWDRDQLADLLVAAGQLAAGASGWMESLDVNPLVLGSSGFVAVDGLCLLKPGPDKYERGGASVRNRGTGSMG